MQGQFQMVFEKILDWLHYMLQFYYIEHIERGTVRHKNKPFAPNVSTEHVAKTMSYYLRIIHIPQFPAYSYAYSKPS